MKSDQNQRVKGEKIKCCARQIQKTESIAKCSYKSNKKKKVVNKNEDQRGGLNHVHGDFHSEEIKDVM